jgi:hypothetical protein
LPEKTPQPGQDLQCLLEYWRDVVYFRQVFEALAMMLKKTSSKKKRKFFSGNPADYE